MLGFLINKDVRAVCKSLDEHPDEWKPFKFGDTTYELTHTSGLYVWAANQAYGVSIRERENGTKLFGGVTFLSSFGLSPSHWVLSAAINRWKARDTRSAEALLRAA